MPQGSNPAAKGDDSCNNANSSQTTSQYACCQDSPVHVNLVVATATSISPLYKKASSMWSLQMWAFADGGLCRLQPGFKAYQYLNLGVVDPVTGRSTC